MNIFVASIRPILTGLALCLMTCSVFAQQGEVKSVRSETDGREIKITYFPAGSSAAATDNAGVVILLHGKNGNRMVWEEKGAGKTGKSFAVALQDQGYAVVSVDLRMHGDSKIDADGDAGPRPNDYKAMLGDLEGVKGFLYEEHQAKKLNMNKTAIVAADDMAPVAAAYAQIDWQKRPYDDAPVTDPAARTPRGQDIRALVLLSPSMNAGAINLLGSIKALSDPRIGMSLLVINGTQDSEDRGASKNVFRIMNNPRNKDRVDQVEFPVKFRGTDLMGKTILAEAPIVHFLDLHLKQLDSEWRDRRSRLER